MGKRHAWWPWLLLWLGPALVCAAIGCTDDDTYEASVADIKRAVRAYVKVEQDLAVRVSFERFFSHEGYGWEHCPVLHARGTVNGQVMTLTQPGGWSGPTGGIFDGQGGDCHVITYELKRPNADALDAERVRFEFKDEGGSIEIDVPHLGASLGLALPEPAVLVPGELVRVAVTPSITAVPLEKCSLSYLGDLAEKSPGRANTAFTVEALTANDERIEFEVPDRPDSQGKLTLNCRNDIRDVGVSGWPWPVERCTAGGCIAQRVKPRVDPLELSLSASGQPVEADSSSDRAGWSDCWFSGVTHGGREQTWDTTGSCASRTSRVERILKATWPSSAFGPTLSLAADGFSSEAGSMLSATVTLTDGDKHWQHEQCKISIDKVWRGNDRYASVIDGHGECTGPASLAGEADLTIDPFEFRVPELKQMP